MSKREKPPKELNVDPNMGGEPDEVPDFEETPVEGLFTDHNQDENASMLPDDSPEEEQIRGGTPDRAAPPAADKLLRVQLRNGQVYTGKNERELIGKLVQAQEHASMTIKDREDQIREARGKVQYQRDNTPKREVSGEWDAQKYLDLLGSDPMEARRYQDKFYYGDDIDPVEALRFSYTVSDQVSDRIAVAEFHQRNPDFPSNPLNAELLIRRLEDENLRVTTRNLESAYRDLVREGSIKTAPADGQDANYEDLSFDTTPPNPEKISRGRNRIPAPRDKGSDTGGAVDFDGLSDEDLEKEVNRRGMKRW